MTKEYYTCCQSSFVVHLAMINTNNSHQQRRDTIQQAITDRMSGQPATTDQATADNTSRTHNAARPTACP